MMSQADYMCQKKKKLKGLCSVFKYIFKKDKEKLITAASNSNGYTTTNKRIKEMKKEKIDSSSGKLGRRHTKRPDYNKKEKKKKKKKRKGK